MLHHTATAAWTRVREGSEGSGAREGTFSVTTTTHPEMNILTSSSRSLAAMAACMSEPHSPRAFSSCVCVFVFGFGELSPIIYVVVNRLALRVLVVEGLSSRLLARQ